jgi:hypothetical protein
VNDKHYEDLDVIDINRVKDELVLVEQVYRKVSDEFAQARVREIRANAELTMVSAITDQRIRAEIEMSGAKKPNEEAIKVMVRLDPEVRRVTSAATAAEVAAAEARTKLDAVARRERVVTMLASLTKTEMASFDV